MDKKQEIDDLDILFPETVKAKSFTARDGKRYSINFFIPAQVVFIEKGDDESYMSYQLRVLETHLSIQYEHMTAEWIKNNIAFQHQNYIFNRITESIMKSNKMMGEGLEAAMPEKKPEETSG